METILKFSPFRTHEDLMDKFELISSETGTLVIIFNLHNQNNGSPLLDFDNDKCDIRVNGHIS